MTWKRSFRLLITVAVALWAGAGAAQDTAKMLAPKLDPLVAEEKTVTGKAGKGEKAGVRVRLILKGVKLDEKEGQLKDGKFAVVLGVPLAPTMVVQAQHVDANGVEGELAEAEVPIVGAKPQYDWGRVHADFTSGAVISRNRTVLSAGNTAERQADDFKKPDLYLDFILNSNWRRKKNEGSSGIKGFSWRLDTFFNASLTTVSLAPQAGESGGTNLAAERPAQTSSTDEFLDSKKSALIQAGIFAPFYSGVTSWKFKGAHNALFGGPILKMGFQTVTGKLTDQEALRFGGDDLYHFWAVGARFGHYSFDKDSDVAPELNSYMDLSVGRWENFTVCKEGTSGASCARERRNRFAAEGRLKVPATPFQIGFDLNSGRGPDDLRFLFGLKFDIGKLFAKLPNLGGD